MAAGTRRVPPGMDETLHLQFRMAEMHFEGRRYRQAIELLEVILAEAPDNASVRTLLARSYYHAAMLRRAEQAARDIIERWPTDAYAHLVLARSLQRQSRHDEARQYHRLARLFSGEDDTI